MVDPEKILEDIPEEDILKFLGKKSKGKESSKIPKNSTSNALGFIVATGQKVLDSGPVCYTCGSDLVSSPINEFDLELENSKEKEVIVDE